MLHETSKVTLYLTILLSFSTEESLENTQEHTELDITQAPWLVSLRYIRLAPYPTRQHYCAGVILGPNEVLTATQCHVGRRVFLLQIRAATNDMYHSGVMHHEDLRQTTFVDSKSEIFNDFAFIRVKEPFKFEERIQPIKLVDVPIKDREKIEIVGWMKDKSRQIVSVDLIALNENGGNLTSRDDRIEIDKNNRYKKKCPDQAGNSVLFNRKLLGITLGKVPCASTNDPQKSGTNEPTCVVYQTVYQYRDWITKKFNASRARAQAEGADGF